MEWKGTDAFKTLKRWHSLDGRNDSRLSGLHRHRQSTRELTLFLGNVLVTLDQASGKSETSVA